MAEEPCSDWSNDACIEKCNTFKLQQDIDIICLHLFELWFRLKRSYKVRFAHLVANSVGLLTPLPPQIGENGELQENNTPFSLMVEAPWKKGEEPKKKRSIWDNIPTWDEFY